MKQKKNLKVKKINLVELNKVVGGEVANQNYRAARVEASELYAMR
ncbi:hypothetical protein [Pseudoalteromonas luteoviolacea]|uniref:Uncharacterized protein n=1 Tax=Pseudoalteromonas luteoviolacea NCIMB 1942 TaxID=1365253 RepID=A0A167I109_9GAMM|nr:hypothetical protein [Pseudoalteromonas luteoviolacea]KZN58771.1 hypothetical protein N482_21440 [Pseudoalteromonas luteoviolacea NCIMB 1942]